jgi:hypothetical protein
MIRIENGETIFLVNTESYCLAVFNALTPEQQIRVGEGLTGQGITADPKQLTLSLDGVLLEITRALPSDQRQRVLDGLLALREHQPVPTLKIRRVLGIGADGTNFRMQ